MKFRDVPVQKGLALITALELERRASKSFAGFHLFCGFILGCAFTLWILLW